MQLEAKQVFACENTLGEAPMFHPTEKALYWLDINGKKLHKFIFKDIKHKKWERLNEAIDSLEKEQIPFDEVTFSLLSTNYHHAPSFIFTNEPF